MNCKGNQLAIIKTKQSDPGHEHYGKIVFITSLFNAKSWNYEGNLSSPTGGRYDCIYDVVLQPIDNPDEDAVDETLTWKCGKPPKVDVGAVKREKQKEKANV